MLLLLATSVGSLRVSGCVAGNCVVEPVVVLVGELVDGLEADLADVLAVRRGSQSRTLCWYASGTTLHTSRPSAILLLSLHGNVEMCKPRNRPCKACHGHRGDGLADCLAR